VCVDGTPRIVGTGLPAGDRICAGIKTATAVSLLWTTVADPIARHPGKNAVLAGSLRTDRVGSVALAPTAAVAEAGVFAGSRGIFRAIVIRVGPELHVGAGTILAVALELGGTGLADSGTGGIAADAIDTEARETVVVAGARTPQVSGLDAFPFDAVKARLSDAIEAGRAGGFALVFATDVGETGAGRLLDAGARCVALGRRDLGGGVEARAFATECAALGSTSTFSITNARGLADACPQRRAFVLRVGIFQNREAKPIRATGFGSKTGETEGLARRVTADALDAEPGGAGRGFRTRGTIGYQSTGAIGLTRFGKATTETWL
jgi:hypothetical protein